MIIYPPNKSSYGHKPLNTELLKNYFGRSFSSMKKIKPDEFKKALKSCRMLRNLCIHNILKFDKGDIHFGFLPKEQQYNINNFFYALTECHYNKVDDPALITVILYDSVLLYMKKWAQNARALHIKIPALFKFFLSKFYHTNNGNFISDKRITFLVLYYILLSNDEKDFVYKQLEFVLQSTNAKSAANGETVSQTKRCKFQGVNLYADWIEFNQNIEPKRRKENPFNLTFEDVQALKNEIDNTYIYETTFAQDVLEYCYKQGIYRGVDFENETNINANEFSRLHNEPNRIPDKRIAISMCVALRLTYDESINLLKKAGYTLSMQIPFDKFIIENSLRPCFYDMEQLNQELENENIKERLGSIYRGEYKKKKQKEDN